MFLLFLDLHGNCSQFSTLALHRLKSGFRPATWAQYHRAFKQFIAFLESESIQLLQVNTITLLAFMEFCYCSGMSQSSISNSMAAIRAMFIVYGLNTQPFKDERIPLYIKSLTINAAFRPKAIKLISIEVLQQIVTACSALQHPVVYKALYLFCFFSFLRLSNILPHSSTAFDITTRGDVIFGEKFATIIVKWSKTMQNRRETSTISISMLGKSALCPIAALQQMFIRIPASKNSPLFVFQKNGINLTLADSAARKHLKLISSLLQVSPHFTFHSFRKSATTWAFHNGVSLQEIMKHGTWSSQAVWSYIKSVPAASSQVSRAFQPHLSL